jgi:predicted ATPase
LSRALQYAEAEQCFRQALEVARRQRAKSLELRAATSLGRLWQQQGRTVEGKELVESVYRWFAEGFDTADLRGAQQLITSLSGAA